MFDSLSSGLEKAWDIVRKDGKLTADNIKAPMREIRRALLEADVSAHLHGRRRQRLHAVPRSSSAQQFTNMAWSYPGGMHHCPARLTPHRLTTCMPHVPAN